MTPRKKTQEAVPEEQPVVETTTTEPDMAETLDPREAEGVSAVPLIEQMVAFHLGGQRYALPITSVQEIQQIVAFSEAPAGAHSVVGMVNFRGDVIPAIDMRALVGLPHEDYRLDTPMVICRVADGLVALVVDEVEDVIVLPEGCLAPPPKLHSLADRMIGVCRLDTDLVFLLSVERLVAPLGVGGMGGW